jgi:hypothetical protein
VIEDRELIIIEEQLDAIIQPEDFYKQCNPTLYEYDDGLFIIVLRGEAFNPIDDIRYTIPFEFQALTPIKASNGDVLIVIARKDFGIDDPLRTR